MVKNKSNKVSPFWVFAKQMARQYSSEYGRTLTMGELQQRASIDWNKLTKDDKALFPAQKITRSKMDSMGNSLTLVESENQKQIRMQEEMEESIRKLVALYNVGEKALKKMEFITMHCNLYCEVSEASHRYFIFAAEVGLVRTTLGQGQLQHYTSIVDPPEKMPVGYSSSLKATEELHGISATPTSGFSNPSKSLDEVIADIRQFLKEGWNNTQDPFPPVFVLSDHIGVVRKLFEFQFGLRVRVWCLENLLVELYKTLELSNHSMFNKAQARGKLYLNSKNVDTHIDLCCPTHQKRLEDFFLDCSCGLARRLSYHFLDTLCLDEKLGIDTSSENFWPLVNPMRGITVSDYDNFKNAPRRKLRNFDKSCSSLCSSVTSMSITH